MIKLELEEYCQPSCRYFQVEVLEPLPFPPTGSLPSGDTIITCCHRNMCAAMEKRFCKVHSIDTKEDEV